MAFKPNELGQDQNYGMVCPNELHIVHMCATWDLKQC
jgi:hypothetical protein